jgi:signal transduction histidine kinase
MPSVKQPLIRIIERILVWLVLGVLLACSCARFFEHPYAGFEWNADGRVTRVFVIGEAQNRILTGDQLVRVGSVSWEQFQTDFRQQLFRGARAGETIPLVIQRDGRQLALNWIFPGRTDAEVVDQALSAVWIAFFFWLMGSGCLAYVRPKGVLWALGVASNYLTAAWIVVIGSLSDYHLWYGPFVLRYAVWFCGVAYLQFHWLWPRPLRPLRPAQLWLPYVGAALIATSECLGWLPRNAYQVAFILMFGGNLTLLALHVRREPDDRPLLRRVLVFAALGALVFVASRYLETALLPNHALFLGLVGMPIAASGYFSVVFRHQLGGLAWRANRNSAIYVFLVALGLLMVPVFLLIGSGFPTPETSLFTAALMVLIAALVSILGYPAFQSFVERRLLRLPIPTSSLVGTYAARTATCTSISELAAFLRNEVLPSLQVRGFAFLHLEEGRAVPVLVTGLDDRPVPDDPALRALLSNEVKVRLRPPSADTTPFPWIRAVMPLRIRGETIGAWLLGDRDPDDEYSRSDIAVLQSLADQTAVALSNIVQTQRLRELYQANVSRNEEERMSLALKLHDSILNRLAALLMKLDGPSITPAFQKGYEELSNLVRGMVTDLRPPMLAYGLKPAIEELAEDRMEEASNRVRISEHLPAEDVRYPPLVELHLYRIVQESLENALQHAHATTITIAGHLNPQEAEIRVQDDGIGFDASDGAALQNLIAQKHFGLAGLIERANLIGARVQIQSMLGKGTRIQVNWTSNEA